VVSIGACGELFGKISSKKRNPGKLAESSRPEFKTLPRDRGRVKLSATALFSFIKNRKCGGREFLHLSASLFFGRVFVRSLGQKGALNPGRH
jgi:hypothetical protein